jgi:rare lipoprotein A (peptidoglycan hydrolase)
MKKKNSIVYELLPRNFHWMIMIIILLIAAWGGISTWQEFEGLREIRGQAEENAVGIQILRTQNTTLVQKIDNLEKSLRIFFGPPQSGNSSWYGPGFYGLMTASGELYDSEAATAAHPWLPFGTKVLIINLDNGRRAMAKINDRGPFHGGRILDVSEGTGRRLGMLEAGIAEVLIIPLTADMMATRPGIQD